MSVLMVPAMDRKPWPSLGPQVIDFIQQNLTFGPGPLRGQPAVVDEETQGLICRAYEVYPKTHPLAGQRRFARVGWSQRKGTAKTEKAAWLAIVELHPDGPVRTVSWKGSQPVGGGVADPYIPLVAFTEEQSEELAFGTMLAILQDEGCSLGSDFDLGLERIIRRAGDGKAVPLASSPSSRDGARTTFQVFDETHHMTSPRLRKAHRAMLANLPKRRDAWALETTTAYAPGEGSVAESTMDYARAVAEGRLKDSKLFFFHRQASDHHDLTTLKGLRAAVREASGPTAKWSNLDAIVDQWKDPQADRSYLERVWLNRIQRSADQAYDVERWKKLAKPARKIQPGALITLGFAGGRYSEAAALVATEVATGHQQVLAFWEQPPGELGRGWEVPEPELESAVASAFERFRVWRLYANPFAWETTVAAWAGRYAGAGEEKRRVVARRSNEWLQVARLTQAYLGAQLAAELSHDGHEGMARHIGAAVKRRIQAHDDEGRPLWIAVKERPDAPQPINAALAGALSWEARSDALRSGVQLEPKKKTSVYEQRGVLVL